MALRILFRNDVMLSRTSLLYICRTTLAVSQSLSHSVCQSVGLSVISVNQLPKKMANITNLIGYTTFINMQAQLLFEKSEVLMNSVRNLQGENIAIGEHAPGTYKVNFDLCDNNLLIGGTNSTADVIARLNEVLDILAALAKKNEKDAKKLRKRLSRNRRRNRRRDDDSDDEINIVMRMRENQINI